MGFMFGAEVEVEEEVVEEEVAVAVAVAVSVSVSSATCRSLHSARKAVMNLSQSEGTSADAGGVGVDDEVAVAAGGVDEEAVDDELGGVGGLFVEELGRGVAETGEFRMCATEGKTKRFIGSALAATP